METSRGYGHLEFREDLKKLYTIAGLDGNPVMLLLTDKQIMSDSQVEDVSNMLNSGEVRDLFQVSREPSIPARTCKPACTFKQIAICS